MSTEFLPDQAKLAMHEINRKVGDFWLQSSSGEEPALEDMLGTALAAVSTLATVVDELLGQVYGVASAEPED